jgi:hypothetical protein
MSKLSDTIGVLLLRNNCVVIPEFGGFVAKVVSAQIDIAKGVVNPPKKALSFNKNLNNNDGLLISTLAQEKNITFDQASTIVSEKVRDIKVTLNKGERVHFQNVGFLYINKAGAISFEQDRFFNLLLSSYGLSSVHFVAEVEEVQTTTKTVEKKAKVIDLNPVKKPEIAESNESKEEFSQLEASTEKSKFKILKSVVKYAAAAVIIPVGFYSFWIPMKTDVLQSGVVYSQDFNPFNKSIEPLYDFSDKRKTIKIDSVRKGESMKEIVSQFSENTAVFSYAIDDDLFVPVRLTKESKSSPVNDSKEIQKGYHLIVGCFENKENASSLVKELTNQGFNSVIVDYHKGLHRVSAAHSIKKKKVLNIREKLNSMDLSSWVLKK